MSQPTAVANSCSVTDYLARNAMIMGATVAWTAIDPIAGIGIGSYLIVCLNMEAILDCSIGNSSQEETFTKIAKIVIPHLMGMACSVATLYAMGGSALICSSAVVGLAIGSTVLNFAFVIPYLFRRLSSL
jgi:hypothetical protein